MSQLQRANPREVRLLQIGGIEGVVVRENTIVGRRLGLAFSPDGSKRVLLIPLSDRERAIVAEVNSRNAFFLRFKD